MKVAASACTLWLCLASVLFATDAGADALDDCNSGDMDRRIKGCTTALKTSKFDKKNKAIVYGKRGDAYFQKQELDSALADYDACIELRPKDEHCWSGKAIVHSDRGEVDDVVGAYTNLISIMEKRPLTTEDKAEMVLIEVDACELLVGRANDRFAKGAGVVTNFTLSAEADRKGIEDAIGDLTTCLRFGPGDPEALGKRALFQHLLGRRSEAVADAEASRKEDPKNVEALAVLAIYALENKDTARSLELSRQWDKLAPGNTNARQQLMKALIAAGLKDEADALAKLTESWTTCGRVTGAINGGKQDSIDEGIAACTVVIDAENKEPTGWFAPLEFRGYLRGIKGDYDGSIADYTRAIEVSGATGKFANFFTQRGDKYASLKKHDLAIADFDAALKQLPDDASALSARATSHKELGQLDQAKADFARLQQVAPNDAGAYAGLGEVAHKTGNFQDAVTNYTKVIELRPDSAVGYQGRGVSLEQLGKKEQAIVDFRKAISIDSGLAESADALKRLGATP